MGICYFCLAGRHCRHLAFFKAGCSPSTSGRGLELRVITAVILGGASFSGGFGKIWGAFLGALFMALINNLLIIGTGFRLLAGNYFGD